jgi:hypothetical protein
MIIILLGTGWFEPVSLETVFQHTHVIVNWLSYYQKLICVQSESKKAKMGMPPLVKALADQFLLEQDINPNEIWRKLSHFFCNDPICYMDGCPNLECTEDLNP